MSSFKRLVTTCFFILIGSLSHLEAGGPLKIVTITADFSSIVKSVGGQHVAVKSLIEGSFNMHDITPKPSMVIALRNADLIIRLGMKQDSWIDSLIDISNNAKLFSDKPGHLDASKAISALEVPTGNIDSALGDIHIDGNPHYWLNPENGILIAKMIAVRLGELDPTNKMSYEANYKIFKQKLETKIQVWKQKMQPLKYKPVIAYHKTWSYFFDAFSLKSVGYLEPLPGIRPSAKHIKMLKQRYKKKSKGIIITALYYPKKPGEIFAKQNQSPFYHLPTNVGSKGITSYEALFDYLVDSLTKP